MTWLKAQFAILLLLNVFGVFTSQAQQPSVFEGQTLQCISREFYGQDEVRSAQYWQFQSSSLQNVYVIESYQQASLCSSFLIDEQRQAVYTQEGDIPSYLPITQFTTDDVCLNALPQG